MKLKLLLIGIITVTFFSCNDTLDTVGMGIQPNMDKINIFSDTVYFDATTVKLDSIYAKSLNGMLGQYYDPMFGSLKSGYVCQVYAPESNQFPDTVIDNKIDSVTLNIFYTSWVGDSLAPMEVSVYPVNKPLQKNYYTNADPTQFCDLNTLWGRKTYTPRDLNVSDSIYKLSNFKVLSIKLPTSIGVKFYEESKKPKPNAFSTLESFTEFFKGVYVTSTYGVGNLINVQYTDLFIHFRSKFTKKDVDGNDSTFIAATKSVFNVTKEVIQLNNYKSAYDDQLLVPDAEKTYVKTPAGIFTKLIIPVPQIIEKIGQRQLSNVSLSLTAYEKSSWEYALPTPPDVVLIPKDSVKTFFENQLLATNFPQLYYNAKNASNVYNFGNISSVIQKAMNDETTKTQNLELLVIPISYLYYTTTSGGSMPYASINYLGLSATSFKKGNQFMSLKILATDMSLK